MYTSLTIYLWFSIIMGQLPWYHSALIVFVSYVALNSVQCPPPFFKWCPYLFTKPHYSLVTFCDSCADSHLNPICADNLLLLTLFSNLKIFCFIHCVFLFDIWIGKKLQCLMESPPNVAISTLRKFMET